MAAQRVHRHLDLAVEVPEILRVDLVLKRRHLFRRLVGIVHGEFVVAVDHRLLGRDAEHDIALHIEAFVELRLLREIADLRAFRRPGFARELLVHARHDAQQRRLTGTVQTDDTDLRAGEE